MSDGPVEEEVRGIPRGTIFGERYRIDRPLGVGGMGAVFTADDLKRPGRVRVVKVLARSLLKDGRSRARFEQEALIGRAIKHPNIVDVLAAGVDPTLGWPWIAMELLEGGTLTAVVAARGALPAHEVRALMLVIGSALAAAHEAGALHRDLKPDNLFLVSSPDKTLPYTVKVLDFGIAKVKKAVTTMNSQLIGSPLWMAPEQLSPGTEIGNFTDVWAFGLIAFYALTGKSYWLVANEPASNLPKLMTEIVLAELVTPSVRARQLGVEVAIPAAFDAWFLRCVARDVDDRFATMDATLAALASALPEAPPAPTAETAPAEVRPSEVVPPPARRSMLWPAIGLLTLALAMLAWAFAR